MKRLLIIPILLFSITSNAQFTKGGGAFLKTGSSFMTAPAAEESSSTLFDDLIACWELDETSGTTVADASENDEDITNDGATVNQTGHIGTAYSFVEGDGDYLYGAENGMEYQTFSVSIWFRTSNADDNTAGIVSNIAYGSGWEGWALYFDAEFDYWGEVVFMVNNYAFKLGSNDIANDNSWHHVVITHTSGSQVLYLDGEVANTGSWSGSIVYDSGNSLQIGTFSTNNISATIDQTIIWNKVLTADEVTELYNDGDGNALTNW